MEILSRWALLGVPIASVLLAGCAGTGSLAEPWSDSGEIIIDEDQYHHVGVSFSQPVSFSFKVTVVSGPAIDFIVFDRVNFQQFQGKHSSLHMAECNRGGVQLAVGTCSLNSGEYYIVIDNTDYGAVAPPFNGVNDPAHATYDYRASTL